MKQFTNRIIFNIDGSDFSDLIWSGNQTGILQLNIPSNENLLRVGAIQGLDQFWRAEEVDLTEDATNYKELGKLQHIYNSFLSYLSFLDSVQVSHIPNLQIRVTCPKVKSALTVQAMQEFLHSQSYQQMLLSILPENERNKTYNLVITDKVLQERCKFIADYYQAYIDNNSVENYYLALVANYILEGIYFYSGFMFFYSLAGLMPGTADMIKLIHRDEQMHVKLYEILVKRAVNEFDDAWLLEDKVYKMFEEAVTQESNWFSYISNNEVLGMNDKSMNYYLKYIANLRLKNIGLNPLYDPDIYNKNPYKYLDKIADLTASPNTKANFFETTVTSYNMKGTNWSDF